MTTFVLIHSPLVGPLTWSLVAEELRRRGEDVVVPVLPVAGEGDVPMWKSAAAAIAEAVAPSPDSAPVLVAHSGAGPLLPAVRMALGERRPAAYIFADAGIPRADATRLELLRDELPEMAESLQQHLEAGGAFPEWTDADLEAILPDPELRRQMLAELRPQLLPFWTEPLPVPEGWPDAPAAYLQFSAAYDVAAAEAVRQGMPRRRLEGGHFHMLVEPVAVAVALTGLAHELEVAEPRSTPPARSRPKRAPRRFRGLTKLIDDVLSLAASDLESEEVVHDLRVACRRLEAGTRVNQGVLSRKRLRALRDAAKEIRRAFDLARDLEVIAAELGSVRGLSDAFRKGVTTSGPRPNALRKAHDRMAEYLGTLRDARDRLEEDDLPERGTYRAIAAEHIDGLFDQLDRLVPESTDEALHTARISTKKLRYELELGRNVFPRLTTQVARLKRLQDIVGRHQDAAVGLRWAEELAEGDHGSTAADRAALMRYYDQLRRRQRQELRRLLVSWRSAGMRSRMRKALGA